jgi:hypothetical protein
VFVRIKRVNGHDYVYLVENAREGGRHVQRVIKTLGRRDQVEAAGLLDQLAVSAARHSRRTLVLSAFHKGGLAPLRRESIGPDLVFGRLWERTGCGPAAARCCGAWPRTTASPLTSSAPSTPRCCTGS